MTDAIGADRVGFRLSPFTQYQGMGMKDPIPQFKHVIAGLRDLDVAYVHLVLNSFRATTALVTAQEVKFAFDVWPSNKPIILAGKFNRERAIDAVDKQYTERNVAIAFGRPYLATPDLPFRLEKDIPFNEPDTSTFYTPSSVGYTDYPFSKEYLREVA